MARKFLFSIIDTPLALVSFLGMFALSTMNNAAQPDSLRPSDECAPGVGEYYMAVLPVYVSFVFTVAGVSLLLNSRTQIAKDFGEEHEQEMRGRSVRARRLRDMEFMAQMLCFVGAVSTIVAFFSAIPLRFGRFSCLRFLVRVVLSASVLGAVILALWFLHIAYVTIYHPPEPKSDMDRLLEECIKKQQHQCSKGLDSDLPGEDDKVQGMGYALTKE